MDKKHVNKQACKEHDLCTSDQGVDTRSLPCPVTVHQTDLTSYTLWIAVDMPDLLPDFTNQELNDNCQTF